jgi:uridylate kinase
LPMSFLSVADEPRSTCLKSGAITLCKENALPLIVLNINTPDAVADAIRGEPVGTLVS